MEPVSGVVYYCKDCEKIVTTRQIGRKYVYSCDICRTKNVAFGSEKSIRSYFHYDDPIEVKGGAPAPGAKPAQGAPAVGGKPMAPAVTSAAPVAATPAVTVSAPPATQVATTPAVTAPVVPATSSTPVAQNSQPTAPTSANQV